VDVFRSKKSRHACDGPVLAYATKEKNQCRQKREGEKDVIAGDEADLNALEKQKMEADKRPR